MKTWGITAYPLKENLIPRFNIKIRAIPSNKTRVTKGERHIRLHFSTSRIQIGQKIHGALLIASTQLMREQEMNVHIEQTDSARDAEVHPYQRLAKKLEHLQELSHGWRCRLGFFSRSSSKLLLEVANEDGGIACSARSGGDNRDGWWWVGQLLAGRRKRAMMMSSSKGGETR
jgi:hypothetical protein